ncbi:MAG: nucleotidyl transferase AbiEii/AbiGii toxin family protein [Candidatus Latescibacteria bacterium]|nr:nucleotidyl transferase AbiEii/AbiGii toxin family protein [Candidatus Latescibacterota bacterium]
MSPNVAASVRDRLLARARAEGEEFERTLVRFASERLLYRLGVSGARSRCLLKGACLLSVWLPDPYRATRDVDLLATGVADDESVRQLIAEICAVPCAEDGLRFDSSQMRVGPIRAEDEYAGKRARFAAYLGRARIHLQVDVGIGDAVGPTPEEVELPVLLEGMPTPRLRAYPREATIAEKFEAMVVLDTRNSRMKDFHDIWALASVFAFDGTSLQEAITRCFERRGTTWTGEVPGVLSTEFYEKPEIEARWKGYLSAGGVIVSPSAAFEEIGWQIARFLGPVRRSILEGRAFDLHWPAGGPWQPKRPQRLADDT